MMEEKTSLVKSLNYTSEKYSQMRLTKGGVAPGSFVFPGQEAATAKDEASMEEPRLIVAGSDPNVYLN